MKSRSLWITRGLFWGTALLVGFGQSWSSRMDLVNDTVSYLDMGDYILAGHWSMAVNGVWQPLYAFLLGVTLHILHPSPYWEYPTVHLLLFGIFLFAAASFEFFFHELLLFRREQQKEGEDTGEWAYRTIGYVVFLWSSLVLIQVSETNPDMLVAAFFYLASGFTIRIRRGKARWGTYAGLGLVLGLGYLTKSIMFPVSVLCLAATFWMEFKSGRRIKGALLSMLVFLGAAGPLILALSISRGKATFGESGFYNYLVHINRVPSSYWQGGNGQHLLHPAQKIFDQPATFQFGREPGGSYPVWYDPSYWYEGAKPHRTLHDTAAAAIRNSIRIANQLIRALNGSLVTCLFLFLYLGIRKGQILKNVGALWFLLGPSVATLCMYCMVHVEFRYIAAFLVVVLLSLWTSMPVPPEARSFVPGTAVLLILMFMSPVGPDVIPKNTSALLELLKPLSAAPNRHAEVVEGLQDAGLRAGDQIASVEYSNCAVRLHSCEGAATWARLGGFRIVAEVNYWPEEPEASKNNFWVRDELTQERVIKALAGSGARIVVSREEPRGHDARAWHRIGNTLYYFRWLEDPVSANPVATGTAGPLAVCSSNPRYFCDPNGNVVYLAGDHVWANFLDRGTIQPPPAFDYNAYMSFMSSHGYNWMRLWTKELADSSEVQDNFSPPPYKWVRSGPGTANDGALDYDFTQLDPKYFSRMRARVQQAGQNGIYVTIMLFNGSDWTGPNAHDGNPFESSNNINGINCPGGLDPCPTDNAVIPAAAWNIEKNYLHKVVDTIHDLPNVMFEVTNESPLTSASWQASVMTEMRNYELTTYGSKHPIGINYGNNIADTNVYDTAADFVSPSTKLPPAATGQCPVATGNGGALNPSSANCKVVINDTDHSYFWPVMETDGAVGQTNWAWENFTLGNGVAFMDPYLVLWPGRNNCKGARGKTGVCSGLDPQWNPVRSAIQDVLAYAKKADLKNMTPRTALSTSGFCLANPGSQYFVFSTGNSFTLTTVAGTYTFEWFNPTTHAVAQTGTVTVGTMQTFTAPFNGDSLLWLHK